MHMFYGPYSYWGWPGMIISMLFWLGIVGGIIYLVYWLVRKKESHEHDALSSMEVLKKRYASGEITREEFLAIKEELKNE